jgi:hypothetical protein
MELLSTEESVGSAAPTTSTLRQCVRFGLHLFIVYAVVYFATLSLSAMVRVRILPLIQHHPPTVSSFQFAFSHLFLFSFYPAIAVAFIYANWYRHRIAYFVWVVPLVILAYKFLTFPANDSVLESSSGHFAAAFHQYFAGDFLIGEFRDYRELFQLAGSNADMPRGMAQYQFTAPLYAAIGYSIGTLIGINVPISKFHSALESLKPNIWSKK